MTNLYDSLGVPKDADRETIRKAYRKRAKQAHPDAGGTPEQFALVKIAHDTLTDDDRRAHYDRTGEFSEKAPDNTQSEIMNLISRCLDMVLTTADQNGALETIFFKDVVNLIKQQIDELVKKSYSAATDMQQGIELNQRLLKKFRRKHKNDSPDLLAALITGRVRTYQAGIANQQKQRKIAEKAIEFLKEYSFEIETMNQEDRRQIGLNILMATIQNMK